MVIRNPMPAAAHIGPTSSSAAAQSGGAPTSAMPFLRQERAETAGTGPGPPDKQLDSTLTAESSSAAAMRISADSATSSTEAGGGGGGVYRNSGSAKRYARI